MGIKKITYPWHYLQESQLLMLPLNRLEIDLKDTWMNELIEQLEDELEYVGIDFTPNFYVSNEWFTADNSTQIAIPFYLLDEKLLRLEKKHTRYIDGKDRQTCMKILRHECGHAIDNAYNLRRLKNRLEIFGNPKKKYPSSYLPNRKSRDYVRYLEDNYAQAHPDEDFAETFATWLDPKSNWKTNYKNWPCMKKLQYMDKLMKGLGKPKRIGNKQVDSIESLKMSLSAHYIKKRKTYQKPKLDELGVLFSSKVSDLPAKKLVEKVTPLLGERLKKSSDELKPFISYLNKSVARKRISRSKQDELLEILTVTGDNFYKKGYHRIRL